MDNSIEIWRPCKNYEGLYEVSNLGRVRSCDKQVWNGVGYYFKKSEIKQLTYRKDGYVSVSLYKNNKGKQTRVHRLVAYAFIESPKPLDYNDVNHIDCDRSNNRVENLEWCNPLENHIHSFKLNRKTSPPRFYGKENKFSTPIMTVNINNGKINIFDSISEGLKYFGVKNPYSKVTNVFQSIKRNGISYGHRWILI